MMMMFRSIRSHALLSFISVGAFALAAQASLAQPAPAPEILIIVNKASAPKALKPADVVNKLLLKDVKWPDGRRVRAVDILVDTPARVTFLKRVAKMSSDELKRYWVQRRYADGVPPPPRLRSEAQVLEFVASFPGSISFISPEALKGPLVDRVQVVATIANKS
jgi:hypothetical protein